MLTNRFFKLISRSAYPARANKASFIFFIGFLALLALFAFLLLGKYEQKQTSIARLLASNTLRMGILQHQPETEEVTQRRSLQLMNKLTREFNWKLEVTSYPSNSEMFAALADNSIDLIADVVIDHRVPYDIVYSASYEQATPTLIYFPSVSKPVTSEEDFIKNQILVIQNSWQSHFVANLSYLYKDLKWQEFPDFWTLEDMIYTIETPPGGYLLVTDRAAKQYQQKYPALKEGISFEPVALAFAFDQDNVALERFITSFLRNQDTGYPTGLAGQLRSILNPGQLKTFLTNVKTRLPQYVDFIFHAANEYSVDWRLIAAIAYQESLWNEKAVSPTGVKGLMMLTNATARFMNIDDRTDPAQSIDGGTRYFLYLKDLLPKRIQEPDRTWLTLAAYNIGPAHLEDVRVITQKLGKNPDTWLDVREHLPLIEQSKWYKQSEHGYARGREARKYVDNIRNYYQVLIRLRQQTESDREKEATDVEVLNRMEQTNIVLPKRISLRY